MFRMSSKPNTSDESTSDTVFDPLIESAAGTGRALVPGTMLEEYEIQRVLSESGFAVVYLAMDHAFDRLVVIKEYQPSTLAEHSDKSRAELRGPAHATAFKRGKYAFMSESRMLASCSHPSLLRVNRIWDANGTVYRVMPYYYGKSLLATRQAALQAPDEASLRSLLDGLLGALEALHEQDCVHGAVAPDNILLLADDRPILMDFGAVRRAIVSPETQRLIAMLEPSYLPVEQVEPAPPELVPGPWSDLYSVAAVLYFCICGDLPKRTRREPIALVARRLQQQQPGLQYSAALLHTIDAALAESPRERPQTVGEFRRLLDTPRDTRPPQGAAQPPAEAAPRSTQGASFPASDDMVNVQGRVVPFARRKEPAALRSDTPRPAAPGGGDTPAAQPPTSPSAAGAAAAARAARAARRHAAATASATQDTEDDGDAALSRFYPSLQEMMAESEARAAADMRRERANNFAGGAPIRPQSRRRSRVVAGVLGVLIVLGGAVLGGWKLNQQRQADEMLSSAGSSNGRTVPASFPPPLAPADTPAPSLVDPMNRMPPEAGRQTPASGTAGVSTVAPRPPLVESAPLPPTSVATPNRSTTLPAQGEIPLTPPGAGRVATLPSVPQPEVLAPTRPVKEPATPREVCGERTDFSLYNCMQTQCGRSRWANHLQCQRLRDTDQIIP